MRDRQIHPQGNFDNQGRWYPSLAQSAGGMTVRSPSKTYPYSYMTACRTLKHTRCVADTSPELLLKQLEAALRKRFPLSTQPPTP
jgi:ribosomal protein S11